MGGKNNDPYSFIPKVISKISLLEGGEAMAILKSETSMPVQLRLLLILLKKVIELMLCVLQAAENKGHLFPH